MAWRSGLRLSPGLKEIKIYSLSPSGALALDAVHGHDAVTALAKPVPFLLYYLNYYMNLMKKEILWMP
jgi:hypothetical protein